MNYFPDLFKVIQDFMILRVIQVTEKSGKALLLGVLVVSHHLYHVRFGFLKGLIASLLISD